MEKQSTYEKQRIPFAKRAARYSIYAPIAAVILNWVSYAVEVKTLQTQLIIASIGIALFVAGLILAIIALLGMRKYGKQGILGFALAGLLINGFIVASTIVLLPVLKKAAQAQREALGYSEQELQSFPDVIPDSIRIIDKKLGFRFELPNGFEEFSADDAGPVVTLYSYRKAVDNGTAFVVQIQQLGGTIKQEKLDRRAVYNLLEKILPVGSRVEMIEEKWGRFTLEGFRAEITFENSKAISWIIQIPLARRAIQVNVAGPPQFADESRAILKQILESLKGKSNWDPNKFY